MAILFPSHYPKPPNPDDPEFVVYQILRKLPDNYTIFYSKKFKGTGSWKEEGEVDFVIFDGAKTILCLEVKGGRIAYDGKEDIWLQNDKVLSPQPDRQATEGMRALLAFLYKDGKDINFGWILGFPNCGLPSDFRPPSSVPEQVIIDEAKFNEIGVAIERASSYYIQHYNKPGVHPVAAKALVERLTRSVEFVAKVGVRVARDHQQLIEVTEEQFRVLEDLEINRRIAIRGFAGTGKTVLAGEFARRLALRGERVLLLFFNRTISNTVRRGFDRDLPIHCTRFFKLARELIDQDDPTWWRENDKKDNSDFWENDAPLRLFDIPDKLLRKYDAIIVDEGQDFRPEWYEFLERLLENKEDGRCVVFYDETQDLFGRWNDLPWGSENVARKQLRQNCRNTKSIVSYINKRHPTEMIPFSSSPEGEEVYERKVRGPDEAKQKFLADIQTSLKQDIKPGQIIVLLDKPKRESCLADISTIGRYKFESMGSYYNENSRSIQFSSINIFKGLEADIVFLFVENTELEAEINETLYVQGLRARIILYVYLFQNIE